MSESQNEPDNETGISDDQLPEDLVPEDNPLAEGLEAGESVDGLLTDGKDAEESEDADTEPEQPKHSQDSGPSDDSDESEESQDSQEQ